MSKWKKDVSARPIMSIDYSGVFPHINKVCLVTGVQIMNNRSLVQVRKFRHIVRFIELCRVNLVDLMRLDFPLL